MDVIFIFGIGAIAVFLTLTYWWAERSVQAKHRAQQPEQEASDQPPPEIAPDATPLGPDGRPIGQPPDPDDFVCANCDYPVRGLPTNICPECGADLSQPNSQRPRWRIL